MLSCSSRHVHLGETSDLITTNAYFVETFEKFYPTLSLIAENAQAEVNSATVNKEYWVRWLEIVKTEQVFYLSRFNEAKGKQEAFKAEKSQIEAYLIANCGGLDVTQPPAPGSPPNLQVYEFLFKLLLIFLFNSFEFMQNFFAKASNGLSMLVDIGLRVPGTVVTAGAYLTEINVKKSFSWGDEQANFQKLSDTIGSSLNKFNEMIGEVQSG